MISTGTHPIGTGPYFVKEWIRDQSLILEANKDYFEGPPNIGEIEFREIPEVSVAQLALEAGDIDVLADIRDPEVFERAVENPDIRVIETPSTSIWGFSFNVQRAPYSDIRVRQAIAHMIDKEFIVGDLIAGLGVLAVSPLSPTFAHIESGVTLAEYSHDPDRAKVLFEEAGVSELSISLPS